MELVYLLVKPQYSGVTAPSEFINSIMRPIKQKPDGDIIKDLISKLAKGD